MATRNRLWCLPSSIRCFQAQTYDPHRRTLLIYNDGEPIYDVLRDCGFTFSYEQKILSQPNAPTVEFWRDNDQNIIRLIDTSLSDPYKLQVHIKWNALLRYASSSDYIALWDDDDYFAADRLQTQLEFLLANRVELVAAVETPYYDLVTKRKVIFVGHLENDFIDGTLLFKKKRDEFFDEKVKDWNAVALWLDHRPEALVCKDHGKLFVFTKHRFNSSSVSFGHAFKEGQFDIPKLLQQSEERYEAIP